MTGVIVLAIVIAIVLAVFLLTRKQRKPYIQTFTTRIECECCGIVCVTTRSEEEGISKRNYTFPKNYDRAAACRTLGHVWVES